MQLARASWLPSGCCWVSVRSEQCTTWTGALRRRKLRGWRKGRKGCMHPSRLRTGPPSSLPCAREGYQSSWPSHPTQCPQAGERMCGAQMIGAGPRCTCAAGARETPRHLYPCRVHPLLALPASSKWLLCHPHLGAGTAPLPRCVRCWRRGRHSRQQNSTSRRELLVLLGWRGSRI